MSGSPTAAPRPNANRACVATRGRARLALLDLWCHGCPITGCRDALRHPPRHKQETPCDALGHTLAGMGPRRIAVISALDYGSAGASQARYLALLGALGDHAQVEVLLQWPQSVAPANTRSVRWVELGSAVGQATLQRIERLRAVRRTQRRIEHTRPDAVLLLESQPLALLPIIRSARKASAVVLHEQTEHPDVLFLGIRSNPVMGWAYWNRCLPALDGLFSITESLQEALVPHASSSVRASVLNMVVDTTRFEVDGYVERRRGEVTYAGSLSFEKDGLGDLVEAMALLGEASPGAAHLSIYGYPDDLERLRAKIAKHGVGGSVSYKGALSMQEVPEVLMSSDCLVLPRPDSLQARYGFPTKLGEYLASATPTVATTVGEIPRFLCDGVNAYLAQPGSPASISAAIDRALHDPARLRVGRSGAALAADAFDKGRAAEQVMAVVEACLSSRS